MISLAELATGLEGATLSSAHRLESRCPKCGGKATIRDFSATRRSFRCEQQCALTEADFSGARHIDDRQLEKSESSIESKSLSRAPASISYDNQRASADLIPTAAQVLETASGNAQPSPTHAPQRTGAVRQVPESQNGARHPKSAASRYAADDILKRVPPQNLEAEQSVLGAVLLDNESINKALTILQGDHFYRESHREIFRGMVNLRKHNVPVDAITLTTELRARGVLEAIGGSAYIAELAMCVPTAANIGYYAQIVFDMALKRRYATDMTELASMAYDGVTVDALAGEIRRRLMLAESAAVTDLTIPWETFDLAVQANSAYLDRTPVIDRLCYSSAVSMITGGKHAGKSTLARWMAVCIAKGWPFLKREVTQGPVFYIASEDETMPARQELIRLGWTAEDPLKFLSSGNAPVDQQVEFLRALMTDIKAHRVVLVVLDMLFDFVRINDEMGYAETRRAVGEIQQVATDTGTHIVVIHHAPKYASLTSDAAVTALGSQGLAARVSPIILVRKHGPGLHSVVSTSVRDPRGQAIDAAKLVLNADGSLTLGGTWKDWMQAEVFAPQVLDLLKAESGQEMTAGDVKEALGLGSYQVASGALGKLYKDGDVARSGSGKKGKPYRYSVVEDGSSNISPANQENDTQGRDYEQNQPNARGQFGYKDD